MDIGVFLDYSLPPDQLVRQTQEYEAAGAASVWIGEAYGMDAVSLLGYLAARTERIGLASGILPLGSRSPALLAMTAAGLDHLSGGRFTLGLGTSGPQVMEGWHGVDFDRPLARTRDAIEVCRRVWRREPLRYEGETVQLPGPGGRPLKLMHTPERSRIPIVVASMGPRNVALTAELADGWLPMLGMFHPDRSREVWGDALAEGTERRAPDLPPLAVVAGADLAIGPAADRRREVGRSMVSFYVGGMGSRTHNFYNDLFRRYGYEDEAARIQDLFLSGQRAAATELVPDEFLEATSLCGDERFVAGQVARYREAGVTTLLVRVVAEDKAASVERLRRIIDAG